MAAFASGILSHVSTASQALAGPGANPMSTPATSMADTSSSSTSSATISANDFLSLLVTEMKNQDPTATTDPNEYINQLVNVNSLEQLIDINQNLTTALGSPSAHISGTDTVQALSDSSNTSGARSGAVPSVVSAAKHATGNLTVPAAIPAAHTVASALSGQLRAHSAAARPVAAK